MRCPYCKDTELERSWRSRAERVLSKMGGSVPYVCQRCGMRSWHRTEQGGGAAGESRGAWGTIALVPIVLGAFPLLWVLSPTVVERPASHQVDAIQTSASSGPASAATETATPGAPSDLAPAEPAVAAGEADASAASAPYASDAAMPPVLSDDDAGMTESAGPDEPAIIDAGAEPMATQVDTEQAMAMESEPGGEYGAQEHAMAGATEDAGKQDAAASEVVDGAAMTATEIPGEPAAVEFASEPEAGAVAEPAPSSPDIAQEPAVVTTEPDDAPYSGPAPEDAATSYHTDKWVNVRSGPGYEYDVVEVLKPGEPVIIVSGEGRGWAEVETGESHGWVGRNLLLSAAGNGMP